MVDIKQRNETLPKLKKTENMDQASLRGSDSTVKGSFPEKILRNKGKSKSHGINVGLRLEEIIDDKSDTTGANDQLCCFS